MLLCPTIHNDGNRVGNITQVPLRPSCWNWLSFHWRFQPLRYKPGAAGVHVVRRSCLENTGGLFWWSSDKESTCQCRGHRVWKDFIYLGATKPMSPNYWSPCILGPVLCNNRKKEKKESEITQLCPTLCHPMDCSLPGSSVYRIFQARILEWVSISFSRRSSWSMDWTWVSCIVGRCFTVWATREALNRSHCNEMQLGSRLCSNEDPVQLYMWRAQEHWAKKQNAPDSSQLCSVSAWVQPFLKPDWSEVQVAQSCLTLCNPMDCSLPGSSVHGILQARILGWVVLPFSRDLPNPGIKPKSLALQVDSLPSEPPGKPD